MSEESSPEIVDRSTPTGTTAGVGKETSSKDADPALIQSVVQPAQPSLSAPEAEQSFQQTSSSSTEPSTPYSRQESYRRSPTGPRGRGNGFSSTGGVPLKSIPYGSTHRMLMSQTSQHPTAQVLLNPCSPTTMDPPPAFGISPPAPQPTGQNSTGFRSSSQSSGFSQARQQMRASGSAPSNLPLPTNTPPHLQLLQGEAKMTLGHTVRLFFSPPTYVDLRPITVPQGGKGQSGGFNCLCKLTLTPTDMYLEQVGFPSAPSNSIAPHPAQTQGLASYASNFIEADPRVRAPAQSTMNRASQIQYLQQQHSTPSVSNDILCIPRVSLFKVEPFCSNRGTKQGQGLMLHTRCFQCLYLVFGSSSDLEVVFSELKGLKGRLADSAFAQLNQKVSSSIGAADFTTATTDAPSDEAPDAESTANEEGAPLPQAEAATAPGSPGPLELHEASLAAKMIVLSCRRTEASLRAALRFMHLVPDWASPSIDRAAALTYAARQDDGLEPLNPNWFACDISEEFLRQGFPKEHWRLSEVNADFSVCPSYPPILIVPAKASDDLVIMSAQKRNRHRGVVATYYHRQTGATILRAAQPNTSDIIMRSWTSTPSGGYLNLIKATCPSGKLHIFDLRPRMNALVNMLQGGGCETESTFSNLENINQVRESFQKLFTLLHPSRVDSSKTAPAPQPTPTQFYIALGETRWLDSVYSILVASVAVAKCISGAGGQAEVALVHCSDGWDRTAQVCSLAQILLDPFFRTLRGLCVLIDKDFIQFGHLFARRSECFSGGSSGLIPVQPQNSPVFLLFLDCLRILLNMYPTLFEYNESVLLLIADCFHSGAFGNFAFDSYYSIVKERATRTTPSFWVFLQHLMDPYVKSLINSGAAESDSIDPGSMSPQTDIETRSSASTNSNHPEQSPPRRSTDDAPGAGGFNKETDGPAPVRKLSQSALGGSGKGDISSEDYCCAVRFLNTLYVEAENFSCGPLINDIENVNVDLWRRFFLRYSASNRCSVRQSAPSVGTHAIAVDALNLGSRSATGSQTGSPTRIGVAPLPVLPPSLERAYGSSSRLQRPLTPQQTSKRQLPLTQERLTAGRFTVRQAQSYQELPTLENLPHNFVNVSLTGPKEGAAVGGSHSDSDSRNITPATPDYGRVPLFPASPTTQQQPRQMRLPSNSRHHFDPALGPAPPHSQGPGSQPLAATKTEESEFLDDFDDSGAPFEPTPLPVYSLPDSLQYPQVLGLGQLTASATQSRVLVLNDPSIHEGSAPAELTTSATARQPAFVRPQLLDDEW